MSSPNAITVTQHDREGVNRDDSGDGLYIALQELMSVGSKDLENITEELEILTKTFQCKPHWKTSLEELKIKFLHQFSLLFCGVIEDCSWLDFLRKKYLVFAQAQLLRNIFRIVAVLDVNRNISVETTGPTLGLD